jgi:hypothetical protein
LLDEPCSAVFGLFMFMVTKATKMFVVSLCRESRGISSSQNFLFTFTFNTFSVFRFPSSILHFVYKTKLPHDA